MARQSGTPAPRGRLVRALKPLAVAALAVAVAAGPAASTAWAHESRPNARVGHFDTRLTSVPPGVRATLLAGPVPAIALSSTHDVVIFGERGEEMARLTHGTIEVNDASATWQVTARSRGDSTGATWRQLRDAQLTWLEPRARPRRAADRISFRWRVPLSVDGHRRALAGATTWVAPGGRHDDAPVRRYGIAALLAATVGLLVLQRRRATASGGLSRRES